MVRPLLPIFAGRHRQLLRFDSTINPLRVDAPDLMKWVEARNPRAIGSWRDLGADEYARAFTAARTAGADVIDDLYYAFADTIAAGGTEKDFAALVIPTLKAKGWLRGDGVDIARRVDLIYDTNLRMARGAGQWDRVQRTKAGLPYLRGVTAQDFRVRHPPKSHDDHRAWQDIVLPADHPFWTRWWTPLGFRCRCGIIQLTRSAALRIGITTAPDLAEREARLGTPIFRAPGATVSQQLADAVQLSNTGTRMPGLPQLSLPELRAEGALAWDADAEKAKSDAIDALLSSLFG